jgi:signal transduction histidine kinase
VRYSEERLQQGLVAARMAVWERDPVSGQVSFSANLHSVFGKPGTTSPSCGSWSIPTARQLRTAPNDRQCATAANTAPRCASAAPTTAAGHLDRHPRPPRPGADGRSTVVHAIAIDITERKRAEEALQLADRRKDEFLAMLAHELRNPLAPIGSAADMLRLAYANEPRVKQISDIVARQVAHMRHLVDDLLDVSRVTRGLVTVIRARSTCARGTRGDRAVASPDRQRAATSCRCAWPWRR